jgi:hypothetical protein
MGAWPKFSKLLTAVMLLDAVLASGALANNSASHYPLRVTVVSAETHLLEAAPPKDCPLMSYSPDCVNSSAPPAQNVLLLRDSDGVSYRVACVVDSRWSECSALPVGDNIDARKEKNGLALLFRNAKGKQAKQFYEFVADNPALHRAAAKASSSSTSSTSSNAPAPVPAATASEPVTAPLPAAVPARTVAPTPAVTPPSVPAPATAAAPVPAQAAAPPTASTQEIVAEKVRCSFGSTPPGAEITLDGKYVGSTPSAIFLTAGTHSVILSMPGFMQWKRELTVFAGSELTVSAALQKEQ